MISFADDKATTAQQISTIVQSVSTAAQPVPTTVELISTTTQQSTVLSSISEQVQAVFIDCTLAILFGILLFIVLIVLFVVIARYRKKIGYQQQTSQGPQHRPSSNVDDANTSESLYSVINKASNAISEQEVVISELYNL
ncbi:uncharacterized protein LOC144424248 [Styela clava]